MRPAPSLSSSPLGRLSCGKKRQRLRRDGGHPPANVDRRLPGEGAPAQACPTEPTYGGPLFRARATRQASCSRGEGGSQYGHAGPRLGTPFSDGWEKSSTDLHLPGVDILLPLRRPWLAQLGTRLVEETPFGAENYGRLRRNIEQPKRTERSPEASTFENGISPSSTANDVLRLPDSIRL